MEKDQVTFAVQASGLKGPLGRPILILCEALDRTPQQFVWLRNGAYHCSEVERLVVPEGPLKAFELQLVQDITQAELYTSLLFWKGVQAELEGAP